MSIRIHFAYRNVGLEPRLLVTFDAPTSVPVWIDVPVQTKKGVASIPIPENAGLVIAAFVAKYKSDFGQHVNMIEGLCTIPLSEPYGDFSVIHPSDSSYVSGTVSIEVKDARAIAPNVSVSKPEKQLLKRLCEKNSDWYSNGSMRSFSEELRHIQAPFLNGMDIPGWCFMMDEPAVPCKNAFYDNVVTRILVRRRWTTQTFRDASVEDRAIVCLEGMQAVANHFLYITDYKVDSKGRTTEVDMFSSLARVISGGDCEDFAKEICALCFEWQMYKWDKGSLAWYGAKALRHYVVALGLGSVKGPKLFTATGQEKKSFMAHAFVMLIPRTRFKEMTKGSNLYIALPLDDDPSQPDGTCMLVGDGTNLKLVDERLVPREHVGFRHIHDVSTVLNACMANVEKKGDRFKAYGTQGVKNNFYIDIVSCMPLGIKSSKTDQSVYHVYFSNEERTVYGAPFADVNDSSNSHTVRVNPTVEPTKDELDACLKFMRSKGFPPMPPHDFHENGTSLLLDHMCRAFGPIKGMCEFSTMKFGDVKVTGLCLKRANDVNDVNSLVELFVSFDDAFTCEISDAIRHMGQNKNVTGLYLFPEYFSETAYGVLILVYTNMLK